MGRWASGCDVGMGKLVNLRLLLGNERLEFVETSLWLP
jgi:hypothetical protein